MFIQYFDDYTHVSEQFGIVVRNFLSKILGVRPKLKFKGILSHNTLRSFISDSTSLGLTVSD
jgi:hypothetical protein